MPRGFRRAVVKINSKGEITDRFNSIQQAVDGTPGMCSQQVRYNCLGLAKNFYNGYTFAFADEPENIERNQNRIKEWYRGIETA